MEFDTRLKLISAGLILAAVAVGYLIFSQRFAGNQSNKAGQPIVQYQPSSTPTPVNTPVPTPSPETLGDASLTPQGSGPTTKGGQPLTKGGLPKTGAETDLALIFSASAALGGWFLRKYPH